MSIPAAPASRPLPSRAESLLGILIMCGGFLCYSLSDMLAKLLTESINPIQVAWVRQFGLLVGVVVLLTLRGPSILRSSAPGLQILRGLTVVIASVSFIVAVAHVPLADAIAVSFAAPFVVTILAALILKEHVGIRRWSAVGVGFLATLVIIRPGLGAFHPAIFLVLAAAGSFAARQVLSRFMSVGDSLATTVAYTGLTATIVLAIPQPFVWVTPEDGMTYLAMLGMAGFAGLGEFAIMRALELAEAVVLAPLQYTLMIWSTLWGFMVFGQLPDIWTVSGTAVIMLSGIYTIYREARRSRG